AVVDNLTNNDFSGACPDKFAW
ncbi:hypothetical protein CP01DC11_1451B, partial [Chlamydia psittaci 01DC11]